MFAPQGTHVLPVLCAVAGRSSILCPVAVTVVQALPGHRLTHWMRQEGSLCCCLVLRSLQLFLSAVQGEMFQSESSRTFQTGWNDSCLRFLSLTQEKRENLSSAWMEPFFFPLSLHLFNYLHSLSIRREIFYYCFLYWRAYY